MAAARSVRLPSLGYWRVQRGLTQEQLASRIALLEPTVARIESGHPALVRTARLLARALSVQVADLALSMSARAFLCKDSECSAQRAKPTLSRNAVRPDGVIYRQQYIRCGKPGCRRCPPVGPGHGPYWYGFYWEYRQRTTSFYVGKHLPRGVEMLPSPARSSDPSQAQRESSNGQQEDLAEPGH
ncbi:MAG: helix-turn-helix transcriptional regulator [Chloroflexota bacterium]|nr:helix-turn-helix transcriptional regulator [Chloroflexota bacterium]